MKNLVLISSLALAILNPLSAEEKSATGQWPIQNDMRVFANFLPGQAVVGEAVTFAWNSHNTSACIITGVPGLTGNYRTSGYHSFVATTSLYAQVQCYGANGGQGSAVDYLSVTAAQGEPSISASFTPSLIRYGDSTSFRWSAENADSCSVSAPIHAAGLSGTRLLSPAETTTVTVTCTNGNKQVSKSATVYLQTTEEPSFAPYASPRYLSSPGYVQIHPNAIDADRCSVDGIPTDTNGSASLFIDRSQTFSVTCIKGSASERKNVYVYVGDLLK
ncbi:hypothetical protein [Pleionea sp. CnH1-48]|uniref:hypothetical protein n=1 Tax=Pleionea sp. CnH1-48 TaxID=2954494 RepID=UPI002096D733|nr:hypothetical protein [Pleionea sp. CnH1-48]MCO7224899.1 hypothetical protein [Pleionea sp. CnH1-48]